MECLRCSGCSGQLTVEVRRYQVDGTKCQTTCFARPLLIRPDQLAAGQLRDRFVAASLRNQDFDKTLDCAFAQDPGAKGLVAQFLGQTRAFGELGKLASNEALERCPASQVVTPHRTMPCARPGQRGPHEGRSEG